MTKGRPVYATQSISRPYLQQPRLVVRQGDSEARKVRLLFLQLAGSAIGVVAWPADARALLAERTRATWQGPPRPLFSARPCAAPHLAEVAALQLLAAVLVGPRKGSGRLFVLGRLKVQAANVVEKLSVHLRAFDGFNLPQGALVDLERLLGG